MKLLTLNKWKQWETIATLDVLFASTTKGVGVYIIIIICAKKIIIPTWLLTGIHENVMQSNVFNMDHRH